MKIKHVLIVSFVIYTLSGCSMQGNLRHEATTVSTPAASIETTVTGSAIEKKASEAIWDEYADKWGGQVSLGSSPPPDPDLYPLYIEGLKHKNANVRWLCAHKMLGFANHEKKQDIINALEPLLKDSDEIVSNAAKFSYSVLTFTFDGPEFMKSKDGNIAFNNYQDTRFNDGKLWLFSSKYNDLWQIKDFGGSIMGINWSPDGKKLAVSYGGRLWCEVSVLDINTNETVTSNLFQHITNNKNTYDYKMGKSNRSDPWITFLEWSPNSDKVLLSYKFSDDNMDTQHGAAVFNVKKQKIDKVIPYDKSEADNPEAKKPKGFKW